jgi:hypothetical protein
VVQGTVMLVWVKQVTPVLVYFAAGCSPVKKREKNVKSYKAISCQAIGLKKIQELMEKNSVNGDHVALVIIFLLQISSTSFCKMLKYATYILTTFPLNNVVS